MLALLALLICVVIAPASWGATTSLAVLSLATSIAAMQNTITILSCALAAIIPVMVYGAFRLGQLWKTKNQLTTSQTTPFVLVLKRNPPRDHWDDWDEPDRLAHSVLSLKRNHPLINEEHPTPLQLPARHNTGRVIRRVARPRTQTKHVAIKVAARWFR